VLILTARRDPGLAERAAAAGAAGVLHKPVEGDHLHAAVRMLLPG
jgi:DNA-binding NarL/FixJ family response regulator